MSKISTTPAIFMGMFSILLHPGAVHPNNTSRTSTENQTIEENLLTFINDNSTRTVSIYKKWKPAQNQSYIKNMIAVAELSEFRPSIENADEINERDFLASINTTRKFRVTKMTNLTANFTGNLTTNFTGNLTTNFTGNLTANSTSKASFIAWSTMKSNRSANATSAKVQIDSTFTALLKKIDGNLQPVLESKRFRFSKDKRRYLRRRCGGISWDSINEIASKTVKQFADPFYLALRKYRLTASSFGTILQAIRRNSYPPSLYKRLLGEYNFGKMLPVQWGKFHEDSALKTLRQLYPTWNITRTGMYLHKSGLLGASPDAITDECVIEIKCPYSFRKEKNLEMLFLPETGYIIIRAANGTYHVNTNHAYYDQVQAEILFSGRQYGVIYIWTPNEAKLFRIEKDESWAKNIDLILDFYMTKFVPYVLEMRNKTETKAVEKIKVLTV